MPLEPAKYAALAAEGRRPKADRLAIEQRNQTFLRSHSYMPKDQPKVRKWFYATFPRTLLRRVVLGSLCSRVIEFKAPVFPNRQFQIVARIRTREVGDKGLSGIVRRTTFV